MREIAKTFRKAAGDRRELRNNEKRGSNSRCNSYKRYRPRDIESIASRLIGAQIDRAVTEMLSGNVFADVHEKESNTDLMRLTLDGLRYGAIDRKKYTGIY